MNNKKVIIPLALAIGCLPWILLFAVLFFALVGGLASLGSSGVGKDKIALIRVSGPINAGAGGGGIFGAEAGSGYVVSQLEKARKDRSVKAIVLRVDSPGGSAAGSQEIYNEIMRVRKGGKIVVTSMGDLAASGGYYIAAASDKIYANGSTITGSIGVIMGTSDMSELFNKLGIDVEVIKSGRHKDMGSSHRKLTPEERVIIQEMIDDVFSQFVTAVSQGRKMPESEVRRIADGRVFTGRQAQKLGLVDQLGGLREATLGAARQVGIKGEPAVVEYGDSFLGSLIGSSADSGSTRLSSKEEILLRRLLKAAPDVVQ